MSTQIQPESDFPTKENIEETIAVINSRSHSFQPKIGIILGTGLSGMGTQLDATPAPTVIPYSDIPHFARSTVQGHAGNLILGNINGVPVICMQGRFHYYEGWSMKQITYPVRVFAFLGVKILIVSNAAGCLIKEWKVGDIGLITDHIGFQGATPLMGPNKDFFPPHSVRFPDMMNCYDANLREEVKKTSEKMGVLLREGVYCAMAGPSFETSAEHEMLRRVGGHFVGMSTVPEVIIARHSGLRVIGFSVMTNMAVKDGVSDHNAISDVGKAAGDILIPLLREALPPIVKHI
ncbi:MAG: purine-nucleoside phosphorylase [Streblomastix strix]|uniref:Purine nucleoside phosphorylase n=1 Tax=Streblomastix strix TaxID=222440 RepID=A0A5J4VJ60_9EUKA|nr:MAG: purine-nucleoside phosphorylase [Streblomastix strix]